MFRLILFTIAFLVVAPVAFSQEMPRCGPYGAMAKLIEKLFGEVPAMTGIVGDGKSRMIMFVDPVDTSWTVGTLDANGLYCSQSTGSALDTETQPKPGKPL
jgi:hypothetical protein